MNFILFYYILEIIFNVNVGFNNILIINKYRTFGNLNIKSYCSNDANNLIDLTKFFDGDVVEYRNSIKSSTLGAVVKTKSSIKITPLCKLRNSIVYYKYVA